MATNVTVPNLGDSVTSGTLLKWYKNDGEFIKQDEPLCELETDKANADIPATVSGVFTRAAGIVPGAVVKVGQSIGSIDPNGKASAAPAVAPAAASTAPAKAAPAAAKEEAELSPAVRKIVEENKLDPKKIPATGPGGRLTKEDVVNFLDAQKAPATPAATPAKVAEVAPTPMPAESTASTTNGVTRTPMSKIRTIIAKNLLRAQQNAAILTTFNEVDLSKVMELRTKHKERFEKLHGVGLGFMSFFATAVALALKEFPRVQGQIDGDDVLTFDHVNLGIAVSTERGADCACSA